MKLTLATLATALLAFTSPALADEPGPIDVTQLDAAKPLPTGVKAKGQAVEQVWSWTDGDTATAGLAVFSSTDTVKVGRVVARKLFVQYYRGKAGKLKLVRLVNDGVPTCAYDVVAQFVPGSVSVTDEDADGVSELTFAYDVTCTSDVSPSTRKLLVLEGPAKHALRGNSRIDAGGGDLVGGDYKADPFKKAPALKALAEARWQKLLGT
ncbi:MAG: hypothetical protein IPL61_24475 [Myxococcales bacterium]|nr:hypothetical protein [Myxococcales bacterium]